MHPSWWWPFSGGLVARPDDPLEPDPYHDQVWALPTQLIDQRNGAVQFIAKLFEPLLRYDHYVPGGHVPAYQNWPTEAVRGGVLHHSRRPGGDAENRTRVRQKSKQLSFTCVAQMRLWAALLERGGLTNVPATYRVPSSPIAWRLHGSCNHAGQTTRAPRSADGLRHEGVNGCVVVRS